MNKQTIFDVVLFGLRAQGCQSLNASIRQCMYRDDKGNRCAVGMWIPDSTYNESMEGVGVAKLIDTYPISVPTWFHEEKDLLEALQGAHDMSCKARFMQDFENRMLWVANRFNLVYTPPGIEMPMAEALYTELEKRNGKRTKVSACS